jgi:rhodanese-related sulfurtransferase
MPTLSRTCFFVSKENDLMKNGMTRKNFLFATVLVFSVAVVNDASAQFGNLFGRKQAVPEIKVEQLRELKLDEKKESSDYVLVDVRTREESSVSVIPGAITMFEFEKNRDRYRDRTVITYCTSGYRSEQYARKLIEKGVKAKNFKGSILEWCRTGLPLLTPNGEPTNRVHTYSSRNRVPAKYQAVW